MTTGFKNISASMWMIISVTLFAINFALVKLISVDSTISAIVFYRSLFSLLILFIFLRPRGFMYSFQTKDLKIHILRGLCGAAYLFLSVFSLRNLNLSIFTALTYLSPMMIVMLSCLFLNEKWRAAHIVSSLIGFGGMFLIIQPAGELKLIYGIAGVLAAFAYALTIFLSKKVTHNNTPQTMIVYYIIVTFLTSMNGAGEAEINDFYFIFMIILISFFHLLAFYSCIKALQKKDASHLAHYEYIGLIISFILDYIYFNENVTAPILIGIGLILIASLINASHDLNPLKIRFKISKDKIYE